MATADVKEQPGSDSRTNNESSLKNSPEKTRAMADDGSGEGEAVAVEFNLSDPDQLAEQLERVDLTEEESEQLLKEAYKVNKQLKMILKQKQENMAASMRTQSAGSSVSGRAGLQVLPPISKGKGGLPTRSLRAYGHSPTRSVTNTASKPRTKSAKAKSTSQRPQWDDRFSYS